MRFDRLIEEVLSKQDKLNALMSLKTKLKYRLYYYDTLLNKILSTKETEGYEFNDDVIRKLLGPFLPFTAEDFRVVAEGRGWRMYKRRLVQGNRRMDDGNLGILEVESGYDIDACKSEFDTGKYFLK